MILRKIYELRQGYTTLLYAVDELKISIFSILFPGYIPHIVCNHLIQIKIQMIAKPDED